MQEELKAYLLRAPRPMFVAAPCNFQTNPHTVIASNESAIRSRFHREVDSDDSGCFSSDFSSEDSAEGLGFLNWMSIMVMLSQPSPPAIGAKHRSSTFSQTNESLLSCMYIQNQNQNQNQREREREIIQ